MFIVVTLQEDEFAIKQLSQINMIGRYHIQAEDFVDPLVIRRCIQEQGCEF